MNADILKPKDLTGSVFYKADTLDFIIKVTAHDLTEGRPADADVITIQIMYNENDNLNDEVGREADINLEDLSKLAKEGFKLLDDELPNYKEIVKKQKFYKLLKTLKPKKMSLLTKTQGEEQAEWKINPKPGSSFERYTSNEDSIRRLMTFMELDHVEIRNILIDILDVKYYDILAKGTCRKEYLDGKPHEVVINFYDNIVISWCGIYYRPEHGDGLTLLEGYALDGILNHFSDLDLWDKDK
jgi:hypothetical protein